MAEARIGVGAPFGALLRRVFAGLDAPHRVRVEVVEELSADLEDLYASLRAGGVPAGEARKKAEAMLCPSAEAVAALAHVHRPFWARMVERYSARGRHRFELVLLGLLTVLVMGGAIMPMVATGVIRSVTPSLLAVAAVGVAVTAFAISRVVRLYAGGQVGLAVSSRLGVLPAAASAALVFAALGVLVGLSRTAGALSPDPSLAGELLLSWLFEAVSVSVLALVITLECGVVWLFLAVRSARMQADEARLLGAAERVIRGTT